MLIAQVYIYIYVCMHMCVFAVQLSVYYLPILTHIMTMCTCTCSPGLHSEWKRAKGSVRRYSWSVGYTFNVGAAPSDTASDRLVSLRLV